MIFLYSGIFSAQKANHPVPSVYREITGSSSPSEGLSRSFSEILRGRFEVASNYNEHGIRIFAFFFLQLIARISATLLVYKSLVSVNKMAMYDGVFSIALFLFCFYPFLAVWKFMFVVFSRNPV